MPIDSKHPVYEAHQTIWKRCRDTYRGEDAVKAAGQTYLPLADPQQTAAEYQSYKQRASFFEAVGRTVDGYVGAVAREKHILRVPSAIEVFLEDATADGVSLNEFIKILCREAVLMARGGVLVDFDADKDRPYFQFYEAEQIINWGPDFVVLAETVYEAKPDDEFAQEKIAQIRRVFMTPQGCAAQIWRKSNAVVSAGGKEWTLYATPAITQRGRPLDRLPFFWLSAIGSTPQYVRPPLLGLVNTALSHYRTSADLEHGRHFAGMPTLYVTGIDTTDPIRVGAATAITLSDPHAKVGYAEFVGQGLGSLEKALETKEAQMSVMGAAAFAEPKRTFESTASVRMRMAGENTLLGSIVTAVEAMMRDALQYAAEWAGAGTGGVTVSLNREFVDSALDGQTLQALVSALQAGGMTLEAFLFNLQQADMLPPETDTSAEAAKLREQAAEQARQEAAAAAAKAKSRQPAAGNQPEGASDGSQSRGGQTGQRA